MTKRKTTTKASPKASPVAKRKGMTMSGFCMWPSQNLGHGGCNQENCTCECHKEATNDG